MHVIVAGGSGLIGRALVKDLAARGHGVTILSRHPAALTGLPATAAAVAWDGVSPGDWVQSIEGSDAVVNLAGESLAAGRWTPARKQAIIDSRVQPGQALVRAIDHVQHRPRVFVQASAVGYYGTAETGDFIETDPPGQDFLSGVCVAWEASTDPVDDLGIRRAVMRTGAVLSLQGGALPRMLLPFRLFIGGPLGPGTQWFSWIHLADEVRAIRFLLENEAASGPFNLVAPQPVTNAEFTAAVSRVMHRPTLLRAPAAALRLVFGEMATLLLEGQRVVPRRLHELGFSFRFPNIDAALQNLL